MNKIKDDQKTNEWLTPDFYSEAYDRFIRLRWVIDPFKGNNYNLNPVEFRLSEGEMKRIPLSSFMAVHLRLSIQSLVGQINGFNSDLFALKAWQTILPDYQRSQRIHLISEFVEPLLHSCMLAPFALRNQITFTGTKIAILLEKGRCQPKLPDDRDISEKHFNQWAGNWDGFNLVEKSLKQLCDEEFIQRTNNFRHRYNHRIPPRIGIGISPNFRFECGDKIFKMYLSPEGPLSLHQFMDIPGKSWLPKRQHLAET